jgi:lipid A 3-O-deacylase
VTSTIRRPKRCVQVVFVCSIKLIFIFLCFILFASTCWSETEAPKSFTAFTFYWENDAVGGTDRNYTNGLKLTWSTPFTDKSQKQDPLPKWGANIIKWLPFVGDPSSEKAISMSLGQNIYTPEKTSGRDLILDDRPYAGWLYLGIGFHSKKCPSA